MATKTIKKYVQMLSATDDKTLDKICEYEKQGKLNEHLDDVIAPYKPVDGTYNYFPKLTIKTFFQKHFIVAPFRRYSNKVFQTKVVGRENLKGVKSAIVCSNHVNKLDCMAIQYALKPHKTYMTAAQFNNMEGFLGDMMRLGGMMPMGDSFPAMKNLDEAIAKLLKSGNYVAFFPERAEWWGYEKPRPLLNGAYHFAVKNNVPIIPVFITFNQTEASKKDRKGMKQFVVNIGKPIHAPKGLNAGEAKEWLKEQNYKTNCEIYEQFYGKKL